MKKTSSLTMLRNMARLAAISIRYFIYTKLYGMDIDKSSRVSFGARLDKTNPGGIHIGKSTYITSGTIVLAHDFCRGIYTAETYIGDNCYIGVNCIILPGIKIGNHVVIGSGAVVT
ncbi:MAG: acyltransferase, partial [Bacteroidales bacterium]|nr:acyltransferase [Bacteroidales bacterium]